MVSLFQILEHVYDFYSTWHKRAQSEATPPSHVCFPIITGYSVAGARTRQAEATVRSFTAVPRSIS